MEHLRSAAVGALPGLDALCDTLLGCFGHDREDDIAMLALQLREESTRGTRSTGDTGELG